MRRILAERRRRMLTQRAALSYHEARWKRIRVLLLILCILLNSRNSNRIITRSCRRVSRNTGWWLNVWNTYSDARFKKLLRVSKGTFLFILGQIRHDLVRDTVCEEPISPECRLAICLYRLARGDYLYTIAEMAGVGVSTVCTIVSEVTEAIINNLWKDSVVAHFPSDEAHIKEKMLDTEQLWQFPCGWGAIDGCHLPLKCPAGGLEACKEYYNFKNFYSIILMGMVDAKYRFIWASCGYPGNSHDSTIFKSTKLWEDMTDGEIIPQIGKDIGGVTVSPLILGDSAFPFKPWLMKPFTNAVLTPVQSNFNYRLSRARMVVECAYGQLKGRWRILLRKCESTPVELRSACWACIVLHNICISRGESLSRKLDLTIDPNSNEMRDRATIRRLLNMTECERIPDTNREAIRIRNSLAEKLWLEKQGHGVS